VPDAGGVKFGGQIRILPIFPKNATAITICYDIDKKRYGKSAILRRHDNPGEALP
jgi:hypothetical protein